MEPTKFFNAAEYGGLTGPPQPIFIPKNNKKAAAFREEGNVWYRQRHGNDLKYLDALRSYNKSICYAQEGSLELSMGYANRSQIYFELTWYNECLQNIIMAKQTGAYPRDKLTKLDIRAQKCTEQLKRIAGKTLLKHPLEAKLSYPPNPKIPFIANRLELRENQKYGRHIVTNRDLAVGDILAIEEPFATALSPRHRYERCENCCEERSMNLIPCQGCTVVMFCGEECQSEAIDRFHKFECRIINMVDCIMSQTNQLLPLRSTLSALSHFKNVDDLYKCVQEAKGKKRTVFDVDYSKMLTGRDLYGPVYGMQHAPYTSDVCSVLNTVFRVMRVEFVGNKDIFTINFLEYLIEIYQHQLSIVDLGSTPIQNVGDSCMKRNETSHQKQLNLLHHQSYIRGMFPFLSLINHSCMPNACIVTSGKKAILFALRPIKAGEQILIAYGESKFYSMPIEGRRNFLQFHCDCIACQTNLPLFRELPNSPNRVLPHLFQTAIEKLYTCDRTTALIYIKENATFLQQFDVLCKQFVVMQESFIYSMHLIYDEDICMEFKCTPVPCEDDLSGEDCANLGDSDSTEDVVSNYNFMQFMKMHIS